MLTSRTAVLALAGALLPAAAWAADIPGNATTKATVPIGPDRTTGDFESKGDHDWYKVTLEKGKDYNLAVTSPTKQDAATLVLRGPDGQFRARTGTDAGTAAGFEEGIEYRPEATGTFFLDVGQSGGNLGKYGVRATGDCRHDASTLCTAAVGQTQSRLLTAYNDRDWYKVTLDAAKTYSVTAEPENGVILAVVDGVGNIFKQAFSARSPAAPKVTISGFKPPRTTTYYVSVETDASSYTDNSYKLTVKAGS